MALNYIDMGIMIVTGIQNLERRILVLVILLAGHLAQLQALDKSLEVQHGQHVGRDTNTSSHSYSLSSGSTLCNNTML